MTTRDAILAAVRANLPPSAPPIPAIPLFERTSQLLLEQFQETLMSMGGKFVPAHDEKNLDALGSRLIKSTIPGRLQDRRTPSSFGPTYRIVWRCA